MPNKISCIITDDEPKMVELLADTLAELYPEMQVNGKYSNWKAALPAIRANTADILFLDISMPEKTGFDLLELVPNLTAEVIFVTAHTEFAVEAFNFDVCGYVLKPITDKALLKAVDRAIARTLLKKKASAGSENKEIKIGIPDDAGIRYININDIIFCESQNRYTKVVTTDAEILSSYNLGRYQETLTQDFFYQIHRSFIINLNHVGRYDASGFAIMDNGTEIPVSKTHRDVFLHMFHRVGR